MLTDVHNYMGNEVALQSLSDAEGTVLAYASDKAKRVIVADPNMQNRNICVVGCSGSGKTTSFVKPFLIQAAKRMESVVMTDVHNAVYDTTSTHFRAKGYIVRHFDLTDPRYSDGLDLIGEIRGNEEKAKLLARCILDNFDYQDASEDYRVGMEQMVTAIALYAALSDDINTAEDVFDMMQHVNGESHLDKVFGRIMSETKLYEARKAYVVFKQAAVDERKKILSMIREALAKISAETRGMLSRPNIDLSAPAKMPCIYYIELPTVHSFASINAVLVSFLFQSLALDKNVNARVPVNVVLDEFTNIGRIPGIDKLMATSWHHDIHVAVAAQSMAAIKQCYPETYKTLIAQCPIRICFGCVDVLTAEYFAAQANADALDLPEDKRSKRPALLVDEALRMNIDDCLIALPKAVVWGKKLWYADIDSAKSVR